MQSEFYPYQADGERLYFEFLSVSLDKVVEKAVVFSPFNMADRFNLLLADIMEDGSLCDVAVSDNHDLEKVMGTVAHCIGAFFEKHPAAEVHIEGSTPSRTRLYRIIFSREFSRIVENYEIYGTIGSKTETFRQNENYSSFLLKQKQQ